MAGGKRSRSVLGFGLRALVSLALLSWLVSRMDLGGVLEVLGRVRPAIFLVLLATLVVERLYGAWRWHYLLRHTGSSIPLGAVTRINFVSTFFGIFLPAAVGVEAFRIYGLSRETSDLGLSFSSVLVDRILGLITLALLVLIGLTVAPEGITSAVAPWAWAALITLIGFSAGLAHPPSRERVHRMLPRALVDRVRDRLRSLYACFDLFREKPGVIAWALVLAMGLQVFRIGIAVAAALAIGLEVPLLYFLAFVPIINFLGMIPVSLGGLGVREAAFVFFFGTVGVGSEAAFTMSILIYVAAILSALPGAWYWMAGSRREKS